MQTDELKNIRIIKLQAHCQDRFGMIAKNEYGKPILTYEGYVLNGLGIGGGDEVELEIDLETGQILNWKKPTKEELIEIFKNI